MMRGAAGEFGAVRDVCAETFAAVDSGVAIRHLRAAWRVAFPFLAARAAPVVLARAKAAMFAFVEAEPLDVLRNQSLDELEIATPVGRRRQELRFEQPI